MFFPVVIATALLTIITMVGGYLLGQHRDRNEGPGVADEAPSPSPVVLVNGPPCRKESQKMGVQHGADGELVEVLKVRTERRTVVYICQDRSGRLYYHANKGGSKWVEGDTALFLSGVWAEGADRYTAQAWDGNTFSVDPERLLITYTDGSTEEQKVIGE